MFLPEPRFPVLRNVPGRVYVVGEDYTLYDKWEAHCGLKNDKATLWSPFSECSKQEVEPSLRNNGVLNHVPAALIGVQLTPQGEEETAWLGERCPRHPSPSRNC